MLLIFDCDGVLVDSELISLSVLADTMAAQGDPMSIAACRDTFMGKHLDDIVMTIETRLGYALPKDEGARLRGRMLRRLQAELQPVAGVADVLRKLRQPRCVASSSDRERIGLSLKWAGLADFFGNAIFSAFDVSNGKPAPDLFLHAAQQMGAAPKDCIVIEDSIAGVTAAMAAGMRCIGFAGGSHLVGDASGDHARHLHAAGAAPVIVAMADLPAVLAIADAA